MTQFLRGLHFRTTRGANYYYDDCSGMCFPCPDGLKSTLEALQGASVETLRAKSDPSPWEAFLLKRHTAYGGFFDGGLQVSNLQRPRPEQIREALDFARMRMLYLVVTNDCNLRCKYCIFSEHYTAAQRSSERMTWDTAKAAVDYFLTCLAKKRSRCPDQQFVVTFYGGEPLLHFDLIRQVVSYVEQREKDAIFSLTTNGVLLDAQTADFLVEHDFSLAISLDGPKAEHDRNRVFPNGRGSFAVVEENLRTLWKRHPGYEHIVYMITYDVASDMAAIREYFASYPQFAKGSFFFSRVKETFTTYYQQFTADQLKQHVARGEQLRTAALGERSTHDPVLDEGATAPYFMFLMRTLFGQARGPLIPATGTCIPGEKICVLPNGNFQICERVPGSPRLGDVRSGLDFGAIADLVADYNDKIVRHCVGCPMTRLCSFCFFDFWSGSAIEKPSSTFCSQKLEIVRRMLSDLYSHLEDHPGLAERIMALNKKKLARLQAVVS